MTEPEYAISSPDDMDHTVHDVFDGFGVGEVVDHKNTERWSRCVECEAQEAFVELGFCGARSVRISQDPEYSVERAAVPATPGCSPGLDRNKGASG